jgi:hypothetical protein
LLRVGLPRFQRAADVQQDLLSQPEPARPGNPDRHRRHLRETGEKGDSAVQWLNGAFAAADAAFGEHRDTPPRASTACTAAAVASSWPGSAAEHA